MEANKLTERLLILLKVAFFCTVVSWSLDACAHPLPSGNSDVPVPSVTMATTAIPTTASPRISPAPLSKRKAIMTKVEDVPVLFPRWDDETERFIYARHNSPNSWDSSDISWWAFDPVQGDKKAYKEPSVYQPSDEMKQRLNIYDDYVSFSPNGECLVYIRAQKTKSGAPLPVYELVELWYADAAGEHSIKLGDLPLPWDQVIWLDDKSVLVVVHYESFDAGISVFIATVDGHHFTNLFEQEGEVFEGVPVTISVSPNGRWVAFTAFQETSLEGSIWVIDRNTDSVQRVDSADARVEPIWSIDSAHLYYIQNDRTYLPGTSPETDPVIARFDIDTGQIHQLIAPGEIGRPLISEWAMSGDGRYFLFAADPALGFLESGLWMVMLGSD